MKSCEVCSAVASDDDAVSCEMCGEGSWLLLAAEPAKKAAKRTKKSQPVEPAVEPVAEPAVEPVAEPAAPGDITDADFAAEIVQASDADLLSLLGESSAMSPSWRAMLIAEIEKRGAA